MGLDLGVGLDCQVLASSAVSVHFISIIWSVSTIQSIPEYAKNGTGIIECEAKIIPVPFFITQQHS